MKKILCIPLLLLALIFSLAACGEEPHAHDHATPVKENFVDSTCAETGSYDEVVYCSECHEEISRTQKTIDKKETHTPVTDPRVEPTFTKTGLTEGSHCGVCGEILVTQETIPVKPSKADLLSQNFTVSEWSVSGRVSYATDSFNFMNDITVTNDSTWVLSTDIHGVHSIVTKTATLSEGENTFYIHVTNPDQTVTTYTVNVYRNHMYTVSFDTDGGTNVKPQYVEEGYLATTPYATKTGYTFVSWNYDFNTPITSNITISAIWGIGSGYEYILDNDFLFRYKNNKYELISYCGVNKTVTLPESINGNNYEIYHMDGVKNVTIPDSVTSIGERAFYDCTSLTSITIPDSVTLIGYEAFSRCTNLTSVTIGNSVTSIGERAFYYCRSLTRITIPDSVTSIGSSAFEDCYSLYRITLPFVGGNKDATSASESTVFGYIFGTSWSYNATETKQYYSKSSYATYYIPSSLRYVNITGGNILYGAFYDCTSLTSVTIGDGVTSIGERAFYDCTSLTSVTIGNSVTSIGERAFYDCTYLYTVVIPDGVTSIGDYAFAVCQFLNNVTIPNSVTSIGDGAFGVGTSLENIYYTGSKEEWKSIQKGYYWSGTECSYTVHCTDGEINI